MSKKRRIGNYGINLIIYSDLIHPDKITEKLKLIPERLLIKGEQRFSSMRKILLPPNRTHMWDFETDQYISTTAKFDQHLNFLLDKFIPLKHELRELQTTYDALIVLNCYCRIQEGRFSFSVEKLEQISQLNIEVALYG